MKENPKHTDHHFTKMSDYKYTLEFVEPRKTYEELQMENRALELAFEVLKTGLKLFTNLKKVNDFAKGGIVNNSEGPEIVVNSKEESKNKAWCDFREGTYLAWKEKNEP